MNYSPKAGKKLLNFDQLYLITDFNPASGGIVESPEITEEIRLQSDKSTKY